MKRTIPIILITSFASMLAGCVTQRQISQEVASSNEVLQEEESRYACIQIIQTTRNPSE